MTRLLALHCERMPQQTGSHGVLIGATCTASTLEQLRQQEVCSPDVNAAALMVTVMLSTAHRTLSIAAAVHGTGGTAIGLADISAVYRVDTEGPAAPARLDFLFTTVNPSASILGWPNGYHVGYPKDQSCLHS